MTTPASQGVVRGIVALMTAATLACARPPALWFERGQEQTQASIDATGVSRVSLHGGVARVTVGPSADDSVHVVVSLRSTDQERLREIKLV